MKQETSGADTGRAEQDNDRWIDPEARGELAVVRHAAARKPVVLGAQPDRKSEGGGVLQGAPQHLGVGNRLVGLRERDAARFRELRHLGQALAGELHRQRAHRVDACARQHLGAPAQHVDQPRLVERRVGVGRTGEAGHPARDRGIHLRFERRLVLVARLAQTRRNVYQARGDHQSCRIDDPVGLAGERVAQAAVGNRQIADCVAPARRGDHAPVADQELHQFPATMDMTAILTAKPQVTCGR